MRTRILQQQFMKTVCAAACLMFVHLTCFGQVGTATLQGTVTDSSGALIVGAAVTVKNTQTGVARVLKTDSQGRYSAPELQIGEYEVEAQNAGFQTGRHTGITLNVGDQRVVDLKLAVGKVTDVMVITTEVTQVETTSGTISALIDQKQMRDLPLNGRNFSQLIELAPGVQEVPAGSGGTFYGNNSEYSISGERPTGQAQVLDGAPIQNFWGHGTGNSALGTSLGVDAIAEFQVFTNTYGAQFGGNGGGINAVTKSGTNDWHGSAYEFLRESTFDAKNFFDLSSRAIPSFHRNQFGGTLGGPVKKNKLFFFVNYEGLAQDLGQTVISQVPDQLARAEAGTNPALQAVLDPSVTPLPNDGDTPGSGIGDYLVVATQAAKEHYLTTRWDYSPSSTDTIFGRYINDHSTLLNPFGSSSLGIYPEHDLNNNQFLTLAEHKMISNFMVNTAQFNFTRTLATGNAPNHIPAFNFIPSNALDGGISAPGIISLGQGFSTFPFSFIQTKFEGQDEIFWTHGRHSITAGVSLRRVQSNTQTDMFSGGIFIYTDYGFEPGPGASPDDGSFLAGNCANPNTCAFSLFSGAAPGQDNSQRSFREIDLGSYFQDDYKVSSRVTVNLGLRYDFVTDPVDKDGKLNSITDFQTATGYTHVAHVFANNLSLHNFDPRLGIAWSLTGDQKTVLRAGFGVFHQVVETRDFVGGFSLSPPYNMQTIVYPNLTNPFTFTGLAPGAPSTSQAADYNSNHTPYALQFNLNLQHDFKGVIATLAYIGSHGVHLWQQGEVNPPTLTAGSTPQNPVFTTSPVPGVYITNNRLNPNFATVDMVRPDANSHYNALEVSANKRFNRGLDVEFYYTWSKCIDNSSSAYALEYDTGLQQNPYSLSQDRGLCAFNAAQNLSGTVMYDLPFHGNKLVEGWELSDIVSVNSGHPFTAYDGFDWAGLGETVNLVERPNLAPGRSISSVVYPHRKPCTDPTTQQPVPGTVCWFDPSAFVLPTTTIDGTPMPTLGDEPRNELLAPGLFTDDFAILKNTKFGERLNVQFRAEAFNVFNHPNFSPPGVFGAGGGVGSGVFTGGFNPDGTPIQDPNSGRLLQTATPSRQLQFALKFTF